MKKLLLLSLLLTACSPKLTPVPVVEHHTDTCYIHDLQLDSVFVHESERTQHDTVFLTRIKEHYRIQHDTIRTSHTDTIPVIRTQEVVREVPKPVPRFYRNSTIALWSILASAIVLLILKVAL